MFRPMVVSALVFLCISCMVALQTDSQQETDSLQRILQTPKTHLTRHRLKRDVWSKAKKWGRETVHKVTCFTCRVFCYDSYQGECVEVSEPDNDDPDVKCPGSTRPPSPIIAPPGKRTVEVDWDPPTVTDNKAVLGWDALYDHMIPGVYGKGTHTVDYLGTDTSGNDALCSNPLTFTVDVIECRSMKDPKNGKVNCTTPKESDLSPILGDVCTFRCDKDYEPTGEATVTCNDNTEWSQMDFSCNVIQCPLMRDPDHGGVTCSTPEGLFPILGDVCTFRCDKGYQPTGEATVTCNDNKQWSQMDFSCNVVTCPEPPIPENGYKQSCPYGYDYGALCVMKCSDGFGIDPASEASHIIQCQEDATWSDTPAACSDTEAPDFTKCPSGIIAYADRGATSTKVEFEASCVDNVDTNVVPKRSTGLPSGSKFEATSSAPHQIRFDCTDAAGNAAIPCQFSVIVQEIVCPQISQTTRMTVDCPDKTFYGATCNITCQQGFPLIGPDQVTCEKDTEDLSIGVWDYGGSNISFCQEYDCSALPAPFQGAMSCSELNAFYACYMSCNDQYDIPRTVSTNGLYVCDHKTGTWSPHSTVYNCTEERRPGRINLPSELYYFSGSCADALSQIQQAFIDRLSQSNFRSACSDDPKCVADNVKVTCGFSRKRRDLDKSRVRRGGDRRSRHSLQKRSAGSHQYKVSFDLSLSIDFTDNNITIRALHTSLTDTLFSMYDVIDQEVTSGLFNLEISGTVLDAENITAFYETLDCPPGTVEEFSTYSCRSCPPGTYASDVTGEGCPPCEIGSYQDEEAKFSCKPCPLGKTTAAPGAYTATQCVETEPCSPGEMSVHGFRPCTFCPDDTYQPEGGHTACLRCPDGTRAPRGAISQTMCVRVDPVDYCQPDPCNGHNCTSLATTYKCRCRLGYSGAQCQNEPDACAGSPCENGATCRQVAKDTFACDCAAGHLGPTCADTEVGASWGPWDNWGPCSVTCGRGLRARSRQCQGQSSEDDSHLCPGSSTASKYCSNYQQCRAEKCTELDAPFRGFMQCNNTGDLAVCHHGCLEGYVPDFQPEVRYACGPPDYRWSHQLSSPPSEIPGCKNVSLPERHELKVEIPVPSVQCSPDSQASIQQAGLNLTRGATCVQNDTCQADTAVKNCANQRVRREAGVVISLRLVVAYPQVALYTEDGQFIQDTGYEAIGNWLTHLVDLENFAKNITDGVTSGTLYIEINGKRHLASEEGFTIIGLVVCQPGKRSEYGLCVDCSPGTFGVDGLCVACPSGTFQNLTGQASCRSCPQGYTTLGNSSDHIRLCNETSPDVEQGKHNLQKIIIPPVILGSLALAVGAALVIHRLMKRQKKLRSSNTVKSCTGGQSCSELDTRPNLYLYEPQETPAMIPNKLPPASSVLVNVRPWDLRDTRTASSVDQRRESAGSAGGISASHIETPIAAIDN